MKKSKRKVDSDAVRVRTAWFIVISDVNGVMEIHLGYRYYDQTISLYSTAPASSPRKLPWGAIRNCELKQNVKNGKGEEGDYFQFENERGEKRMFKIQMMNPLLWGINDFTQKVAGLRVGHKEEAIGMYLTKMNTSQGFFLHRAEIHDEWGFEIKNRESQVEDMEKINGDLDEYKEFVLAAQNSALKVDKRVDCLKQISTKPSDVKGSDEVKAKKSKCEVIEEAKQAEIDDETGIEKIFSSNYFGRAFVSIDNLSVSKQVFTQMNKFKVLGLAKSIENRCDPSNLVMTVVPKDMNTFNEDDLDDNEYEILNGRHRFEALVNLDKKGVLSSLKGLEERKLVCYVLKTNCTFTIQANYGQLRGNELQASYVRPPHVHEILYVAKGLKDHYSDEQVEEILVRYCKLLSVNPDQVTAVKKFVHWENTAFDMLLTVFKQYESLQTSDIFSSTNLEMYVTRGMTQPVPTATFKQLGQADPELFLQQADRVLKKKLSLKDLVTSLQKVRKRDQVAKVIVKEVGCLSIEALSDNYPEKFTGEILDKYHGAVTEGKCKNKTGEDLKIYIESVLKSDGEKVPTREDRFVEINTAGDIIGLDMSEADTVVFNLKGGVEISEFAAYLKRMKEAKPSVSFVLLFNTEEHQQAVKSYLSTKEFQVLGAQQIFFDAQDITISASGVYNNLKFALVCWSYISKPPLKVYNGNLSNLKSVVEQVSPEVGLVAVVNEGSLSLVNLDLNSSVVYYGEKHAIEKFKREKSQAKGVFENHLGDAEVRMDQTIESLAKSLPPLDVEGKGDLMNMIEEKDVSKENIKPQSGPS